MKRLFVIVGSLVAVNLAACDSNNGAKEAENVCKCYTDAGNDMSKAPQCLTEQLAAQERIKGSQKETMAFLQTLQKCTALGGGR
ncbi:hypothetical protein [Paramagnetospirillum caucaseum]|uniref:hypothetical protein n=1 Tax=Paramagnetospirillum caucaseum TaxID=1244869 RepID=UPI001268D45B|nr:hypothetical protein [Paramagnetospirillum caucaseum]